MNKDYDAMNELVKDFLEAVKQKNYISMADIYDEIMIYNGLKYAVDICFFTQLQENGVVEIPKAVIKLLNYENEPVLISTTMQNDIVFDKMYEGCTIESLTNSQPYGKMFEIVKHAPIYENDLMEMIHSECDDWKVYWGSPNASVYRKSLEASITYLALSDGKVCGYSRFLPDALYIYVCDLLVDKAHRGNGLGKKLIDCIKAEYPKKDIYVMSGNDEYYKKIGCRKEGSVFLFQV